MILIAVKEILVKRDIIFPSRRLFGTTYCMKVGVQLMIVGLKEPDPDFSGGYLEHERDYNRLTVFSLAIYSDISDEQASVQITQAITDPVFKFCFHRNQHHRFLDAK